MGKVIFCETSADDTALENAKAYCQRMGFTVEQVKILRKYSLDLTVVETR